MKKKVAVLVVNPVNGLGLFQYLETFFENGIPFQTFAVAETTHIKTNSGVALQTDCTIADLKGKESEFDALVFACGDAMPKFSENAGKPEYQDMLAAIRRFGEQGKLLIGHCVGGLLFDIAGVAAGKRLAVHPFAKNALTTAIDTDEKTVIDGNIYTAQNENALAELLPKIVEKLK